MKRVTVILIKVTECSAFLPMLLVCIRSYLKSLLRYNFLVFLHLSSAHYISKEIRNHGYISKPRADLVLYTCFMDLITL